jgi:hypothetical protein
VIVLDICVNYFFQNPLLYDPAWLQPTTLDFAAFMTKSRTAHERRPRV